ncbi:hypothetical protein GF326_11055 [Candidatus Bathyarchaeota archaeon]|nr:hypothetical protein [Candidatus Bathyarchaeota archaeon]
MGGGLSNELQMDSLPICVHVTKIYIPHIQFARAVHEYYRARCETEGVKPYSYSKIRTSLHELELLDTVIKTSRGFTIATNLKNLKEKLRS